MTSLGTPRRSHLVFSTIFGLAVAALVVNAADPPDFKPDHVFAGSSLSGWHVVGQADWKAVNGEIAGRAKAGAGGWLMLDQKLQDLQFFANVRCDNPCKAGVLFRAEQTADGGMKGIYVSLADGDLLSYRVTLGAAGQETAPPMGPIRTDRPSSTSIAPCATRRLQAARSSSRISCTTDRASGLSSRSPI
jgi:hypothetical protein